jgi:pilus assembly protein FimV
LVNLNWPSGGLTKTFTLLVGDVQKVTVKPGQSLSEIAAMIAPQLDGATLDQTMMALYKANPDAFASGSINRLAAGVELSRPSQALLRSISPAEANQFVAQANEQWQQEHDAKDGSVATSSKSGVDKTAEALPKDRLRIGSGADSSDQERRYAEELVAQEKMLEQTKARVAELEKNIADLQRLLDKNKEKKAVEDNFGLGGFGPVVLAIALIALTGLLLWGLARNARRSETPNFQAPTKPTIEVTEKIDKPGQGSHLEMPARAKALFEGIDLDLTKAGASKSTTETPALSSNPLADTLRVKLNLARAYITIEDFTAAKKTLEEVLRISNTIDPAITVEAQGLLIEISHRNT